MRLTNSQAESRVTVCVKSCHKLAEAHHNSRPYKEVRGRIWNERRNAQADILMICTPISINRITHELNLRISMEAAYCFPLVLPVLPNSAILEFCVKIYSSVHPVVNFWASLAETTIKAKMDPQRLSRCSTMVLGFWWEITCDANTNQQFFSLLYFWLTGCASHKNISAFNLLITTTMVPKMSFWIFWCNLLLLTLQLVPDCWESLPPHGRSNRSPSFSGLQSWSGGCMNRQNLTPDSPQSHWK